MNDWTPVHSPVLGIDWSDRTESGDGERMGFRNSFFLVLLSIIMTAGLCGAGQANSNLQTFSGEIMDDLCAKDKTHSKMMEEMKSMGTDPAVCSRKCVELGAKYVLYDRQKDAVYSIEDQDKAEAFAGRKVRILGTFDKKKIKIEKIEPAESSSLRAK